MRKGKALYGLVILCALTLALPGVAGAQELVVPFFNDSSPAGNPVGGPAPNQYASWIRVQNLSASSVVLTITYRGFQQDPAGTEEIYTFQMGPYAGVSWRPYADDIAEGTWGRSVPNYTVQQWGSALIESTIPDSLAGNCLQLQLDTIGGVGYSLIKPQ